MVNNGSGINHVCMKWFKTYWTGGENSYALDKKFIPHQTSHMNLSWQNAETITKWIPIEQCKDNWLYHIAARNASLGIYRSQKQGFEIRRDKLGSVYRFIEYHWDWQGGEILFGKKMLGTAKPLQEIEQAPAFGSGKEFIVYMEKRFEDLKKGKS